MTWLPKSVVCLRYYDRVRFRSDLAASLVLAPEIFAASIAIATASGLPPVYGASCAAAAAFVASAFGDSKIRISAPSILLIAVVSPIVTRDGVLALSLSTLLAGILLAFFGAIRLGAAIQRLPRAVTLGFSTGIVVLIIARQLPILLGISPQISADGVGWGRSSVLRLSTQVDWRVFVLGLAALILIVASKRLWNRIPAGSFAMAVGVLLVRFWHFKVSTVGKSGVALFSAHLPNALRPGLVSGAMSTAFMIAVLVAIESVEAVALSGGLTGEGANPSGELIVEGGVNIATALVGGLPASGSSSHSSDNAFLGAQTPVAGILQSVLLVGCLFLLAPLLQFLPLAVMSAVVLSIVCGMRYWRELSQLIKLDRTEMAAWLTVSVLTIVNLAAGVAVGMLVGMVLHARGQSAVRLGESSTLADSTDGPISRPGRKPSRLDVLGPKRPGTSRPGDR